jgi:hypothetical protein
VTYITERGERKPYWANRFRQALQRAVDVEGIVEFVTILMLKAEPSRGFFYLKDAGRLEIAVEAIVVDETMLYPPAVLRRSRAGCREPSGRAHGPGHTALAATSGPGGGAASSARLVRRHSRDRQAQRRAEVCPHMTGAIRVVHGFRAGAARAAAGARERCGCPVADAANGRTRSRH